MGLDPGSTVYDGVKDSRAARARIEGSRSVSEIFGKGGGV